MSGLSIVNHLQHFVNGISEFKKDPRTTDVVLVVEDEKLPAHRFILGSYSEVLATLFYGDFKESREFEVSVKAPKVAMKILLDYCYAGFLKLESFNIAEVVDLLELSQRFDLKSLEDSIVKYLSAVVQPCNVAMVLEMALLLEIKSLEAVCWPIVEMIIEGLFDAEIELSEKNLRKFLEQKPRRVSEIKLFQFLHRKFPEGIDETFLSCIDFTLMTPNQIVDIVQPTKALGNDFLFDVIREKSIHASIPLLDRHLTALRDTFKIFCKDPHNLFQKDDNYASFEGPNEYIMIDLDATYIINCIEFKLKYERLYGDDDYASYCIEVSRDKELWKTVVDFSESPCSQTQKLSFSEVIVKYIRIGIVNDMFKCNSFKVCYLEQPAKSLAGYLCPSDNIAYFGNLFVKRDKGSIYIIFHQPYILNSCSIRLVDFDSSRERFSLSTSMDRINFSEIYSKEEKMQNGWHTITFGPRFVKCFLIEGWKSSSKHDFSLSFFDCPAP